ncbi:MAG: prepilin-type N-terminal cleavage/methylation domain-containing protein [Candidatus Omnitrophica bacterium]|nr:prepilin-type N-terminal cleavage/methylation domain-containing protein [Candidatus Omnitrophota bacterium]
MHRIKTPLEEKSFSKSKPLVGFAHFTAKSQRTTKGFTLMEVVVSLIILATVFGGLTATFVGVKRYVSRASRRLTVVNLGKEALNALYIHVRADTWNNAGAALAPGRYSFAAGAITQVPNSIAIDGFTYGDAAAAVIDDVWPDPNNYTVRTIAGRDYREVTVHVWYPTN